MPNKLCYDYVKQYVEDKGCKLLSKEYVNNSTPLSIQCKCGNIFETTFNKIKIRNQIQCKQCKLKASSQRYRMPFEKVIERIKGSGCEYISGEYTNQNSILTLKCKCGNIFNKKMSKFFNGQDHCQECGKLSSAKSKIKYTRDDAVRILGQSGYTLIGDYKNGYMPIKCLCSKGHSCNIILSSFITNHSGCKKCANENLKGEKHWNYKGGESEVIDFFRKQIKGWKIQVFNKYNRKCVLTDSKKDTVVHHIKPFMTILHESCNELNLPLERKIKDYSQSDFDKLTQLVLSKHIIDNGIVLQRKVHNKFHAIYGKVNNTKEQFVEFVEKYYTSKKDKTKFLQ